MNRVLTPGARRRTLAAVIACIGIYGITSGLGLPLVSLILEQRGVASGTIGLIAAMPSVAMLLGSPWLPRLMRRFGMRVFLLGCILADALLLLLLPVFRSVPAWALLRFLSGFTVAGMFVAGEIWINAVALDRHRGRVSGLYNTILAGSFGLGPLLIPLTGTRGALPFLVAAGMVIAAAVPLLLARPDDAPSPSADARFSVFGFLRVAPLVSAAIVLVAVKEVAAMSLLPVYGVQSGLSTASAAVMLSALAAGALTLQFPVGWLADHWDRRSLLIACAGAGALGAAALPWVIHSGALMWLLLYLWGGLFSGLYTVSMTIVGHRFKGAELVNASAAFGLLWGIGSVGGPAVAGFAMELWKPNGLIAVLSGACALFVLFALARGRTADTCAAAAELPETP